MAVAKISEFTKAVLQIVESIPKGKVASYKQVAELAGKPQASRGVSWILHSCSTKYRLPWHRVLSSKGQISFDKRSSHFIQQRKRLISDGIVVQADGSLDLQKYQWKTKTPKNLQAKTQNQIRISRVAQPAKGRKPKSKPKIFSS